MTQRLSATYTCVDQHLLKYFVLDLQAHAQLCLLELLLTAIKRRPLLTAIVS